MRRQRSIARALSVLGFIATAGTANAEQTMSFPAPQAEQELGAGSLTFWSTSWILPQLGQAYS